MRKRKKYLLSATDSIIANGMKISNPKGESKKMSSSVMLASSHSAVLSPARPSAASYQGGDPLCGYLRSSVLHIMACVNNQKVDNVQP